MFARLPLPASPPGAARRPAGFLLRWLLTGVLCLGGALTVLALIWHAEVRRLADWEPPQGPDEHALGRPAPDFTLRDLDGKPFHLAEEYPRGPVVLEIGSFT